MKYFDNYLNTLKEELIPAMGCTEPIAVAYAAALARKTLGALPTRVHIAVSGNILKNVKSVIVPNTGGLFGVSAAAAAGIVAGNAEKKLEALTALTDADRLHIAEFLKNTPIEIEQTRSGCVFDIAIRVFCDEESAFVRIEGKHTNVVEIEKNGDSVLHGELLKETQSHCPMNVENIITFADTVPLDSIAPLIERQISYNSAISREGLKNDYGARVGKVLLSAYGSDVHVRAKAAAAAGSDARMNGCSLPVVIVSGSGNQGMTASLPVLEYANDMGASHEQTIRAIALSDLVTIHLKAGIGRLSAYCGAVSAGAGAGAGICYLHGGKYDEIAHTIVNALAISSGIVCDGAKSSCAAKIAAAVDAGIFAFEMSRRGSNFLSGDGILSGCVERTISNVGELARVGMRETDEEIIRLMIKSLK